MYEKLDTTPPYNVINDEIPGIGYTIKSYCNTFAESALPEDLGCRNQAAK